MKSMETLMELVKAQDDYIKLLEESERNGCMFLHEFGIKVPQEIVERGSKCRSRIKELRQML